MSSHCTDFAKFSSWFYVICIEPSMQAHVLELHRFFQIFLNEIFSEIKKWSFQNVLAGCTQRCSLHTIKRYRWEKKIEVLQMLDGEPIWLVLCLMGWVCLTVFRTSMVWFGLLSLFTDAWPVSGCLELVSPSLSLAYIFFHTNGWLEPIYNGDHGRGFQTMVLSCHPFCFLSVWVGWFL